MVGSALFSSASCDWATPQDLFDDLNEEFQFVLDVCATPQNAKCKNFFTREQDGLRQDWSSFETVWCNPPYGRGIGAWVKKCVDHVAEDTSGNNSAVMLLPARTDTRWFHDYLWLTTWNRPRKPVSEIRFLKGRLRFGGSANSAPFPSMIVVIQG